MALICVSNAAPLLALVYDVPTYEPHRIPVENELVKLLALAELGGKGPEIVVPQIEESEGLAVLRERECVSERRGKEESCVSLNGQHTHPQRYTHSRHTHSTHIPCSVGSPKGSP